MKLLRTLDGTTWGAGWWGVCGSAGQQHSSPGISVKMLRPSYEIFSILVKMKAWLIGL